MKKIVTLIALGSVTLLSCKKETRQTDYVKQLPRVVVSISQKKTEISKTVGSSASIVLVGGFGSELGTWEKLYAERGLTHTIFAYNRPGIGLSEDISGKRDAATIAAEMKRMLELNNINPPYILVGHSMGGIYARMFYHQNPSLVKGLVLVDATHERQIDSLLSFLPPAEQQNFLQMAEAQINDALANMPNGSLKEEFRSNFKENYEQMKAFPAITQIPVYVITSTKPTDSEGPFVKALSAALHQEWATAAGTKGKFISTANSGHYIQVEEPKLVYDGIKWVLNQ